MPASVVPTQWAPYARVCEKFLHFQLFLSRSGNVLDNGTTREIFLRLGTGVNGTLVYNDERLALYYQDGFRPITDNRDSLLPVSGNFTLPYGGAMSLFVIPINIRGERPYTYQRLISTSLHAHRTRFFIGFRSYLTTSVHFHVIFRLFCLREVLTLSLTYM